MSIFGQKINFSQNSQTHKFKSRTHRTHISLSLSLSLSLFFSFPCSKIFSEVRRRGNDAVARWVRPLRVCVLLLRRRLCAETTRALGRGERWCAKIIIIIIIIIVVVALVLETRISPIEIFDVFVLLLLLLREEEEKEKEQKNDDDDFRRWRRLLLPRRLLLRSKKSIAFQPWTRRRF